MTAIRRAIRSRRAFRTSLGVLLPEVKPVMLPLAAIDAGPAR